ncbi:pseudouridine-5-phosphate glycosidase [Rhodobacteraceae bacterium 2CG4]|uniref:Pseudouridine-5'-phosphate glycosidase n=1 Tax=Halovulum marinum TaxID=2662447 RepID=A0A6L5Z079_9RHOB|nr:pseudouridine-5'-phosphate glycosidase [Halovulum marinum]MSU89941.1 pseudouridine-5-phosphate glycosidase [Halovulum marinum]
MTAAPLSFSPEVAAARAAGRPVVALESTIITHGMPYPRNLQTARAVEAQVRRAGAVPATIAVRGGRIRIGLDDGALEALAQEREVWKLSRADLAVALALGRTGATTVAATMIAAHAAGIEVFATGGIGGVHRGAEDSLDISADLTELAETPVCVVAAGPKAILDIPRTLEVLETRGVPVIAVGQDNLPAFWSRDSRCPAPARLDDAASIAAAFAMRRRLGLPGGQLVANPIPADAEIPAEELAPHIAAALDAARADGIAAKQVTPFLLQRILELTGGRSLEANIALVLNNARLAAEIACALHAGRVAAAADAH